MSYLVKLLIFSVVVVLAVYVWNANAAPEYGSNNAYFITGFFFLFSWFNHRFLTGALKSNNKNEFTYRFLGSTGIKLFLSLMIILLMAFLHKQTIVPFAIMLMIHYFLFTAFEIIHLLKVLKAQSQ